MNETTQTDFKAQWELKVSKLLVGKTIATVRYMRDDEVASSGFYSSPLVIIFNDGSYIFPMRDDEGNDAGALGTSEIDLPTIPVI